MTSKLLHRRGSVPMVFFAMSLAASLCNASIAAAQTAPPSAGSVEPQLIEDLVAANRILADQGVLDGWGHVSARHPRNPNRYLLSRSRAPELISAEDIMEFDLDSNPVDARGRPLYTERFIHGEIYKARPDVVAIVHTHAPALIPFGISKVPLKPVYHRSAFIAAGVPVFEIRERAGMTDMLIRDQALGSALADALGNHPAALMRGHGAVVVGPSLQRVVGRSIFLPLNATLQMQAAALGGPVTYLDPEEARKIEEREGYGLARAWEAWKRKAMAKQ
jgi:ribulose-5-phosphate 4-epimerase/fuculose-1-phosphate aldolase